MGKEEKEYTPAPAFPQNLTSGPMGDIRTSLDFGESGMTLHEWYAGQALIGLVVNYSEDLPAEIIARFANELADAMMKEREMR